MSKACMVWACYMSQYPLKDNHLSENKWNQTEEESRENPKMITLVNWKDSDISIIVHITKDEEQWLADCSTFGKAVNLNSSGSPGMLPLLHILFNIFVIFMQTCSRVSFSSKVVFDYGAFFMLIHNPHLCLENLNLVCYEFFVFCPLFNYTILSH